MNALRLLTVGAIVCLLSAGARAEEKPDLAKQIVGKWECTKADEGTLPVGAIVEFGKDGKMKTIFKMGDMEMKLEGTYTVEAHKFTFKLKQGDMEHMDTITVTKISDKEMVTENGEGKKVTLAKKK
jgi:uncharacterized protein (TIGR03066 family)